MDTATRDIVWDDGFQTIVLCMSQASPRLLIYVTEFLFVESYKGSSR
jgi:hypothetical protein